MAPHSKNSECVTSLDGGKTWQSFKPKTRRAKKVTIEYDPVLRQFYSKIVK